jgi:hypothetical protein
MKNGKPRFSSLSLDFSSLSRDIFVFHFYFIFQNLNFLNCSQPVFNEPKKLVQTSFISFHKNRLIFVKSIVTPQKIIHFTTKTTDNPSHPDGHSTLNYYSDKQLSKQKNVQM